MRKLWLFCLLALLALGLFTNVSQAAPVSDLTGLAKYFPAADTVFYVAVRTDEQHADAAGLELVPHEHGEVAVELELGAAARTRRARLREVVADVDRDERRLARRRRRDEEKTEEEGAHGVRLSPG